MLIYNATNKHLYSPVNYRVLAEAIEARGWTSGEFAGFQQWKSAGRAVRKGEKGVPVAMFVEKAIVENGQQAKVKVRKTKYVFNVAQTEPVQ